MRNRELGLLVDLQADVRQRREQRGSNETKGQFHDEAAGQDRPSQGQMQREPQGQIQREQSQPQRQRDQGTTGQSQRDQAPGGMQQRDRDTTGQGQREPQRSQQQRQRDRETTGQGQREPERSQQRQRDRDTTGQGQREPERSQQRQETPRQGQAPQRQEQPAQQGRQDQTQGVGGGSVSLTAEQRTKIRQSVLPNAPRTSNVNFSISVGTTVPERVRVVAVPKVIVDVHPEWRGYLYFVVDERIIIVDRNHRIVAILVV